MFNNYGQPQQNLYGAGFGNGMGMQYAPVNQAKMTQPLSEEDKKLLRQNSDNFSLQVSPMELKRSVCTHKDANKITLIDNGNGTATCTICGATFELVNEPEEQIEGLTRDVISVLQSIKTYFLDIPEQYANEYFKVIPLLEKLPVFYKMARSNWRRYENANPLQNANGMYSYNLLQNITSPGYAQAPGMMPQMSPYGAPMGTPAMGGYPQQSPDMFGGYPQQQQQSYGNNPFGNYGQAPAPGYNPALDGSYGQQQGYGQAPAPQPTSGPQPTASYQPQNLNNTERVENGQVKTTATMTV